MPFNIAMICDFFHPSVGGVENHIYMLSVNLLRLGHKVIVITHAYPPDRIGIRHILPHLKVYYLPLRAIASSATLPNFFTFLPYFRSIVLREHIQIVHGHASLSSMAQEGILHSHHMGVRTVFTDHSLFGFDDATGILTNKLLAGALTNVDAAICVSHTGRENTVLRAQIPPSTVHVIPNAVVPQQFRPSPQPPSTETIHIIVISRLVYRKGIDLLVAAAPRICALHPRVKFIVGGDGPKMTEMEQMREKHLLQDRVILLGSIRHNDVRDVLIQGNIYLNTSLTESFGIGILEAACAGLHIVSTRVGGVPEVLPEDMVSFANPEEDDIVRALSYAIEIVSAGGHNPFEAHERVKGMYDWGNVAIKTVKVYEEVTATRERDLWGRMESTMALGTFAGPIYLIILVVDCMFFAILEWLMPRDDIDYVKKEWDPAAWSALCELEEKRLRSRQSLLENEEGALP